MLDIDVFADIVCPWCYVGADRLERAIASFDPPLEVRFTYHPFLLDPGVPREGVNIPEMLRKKYGVAPEAMFARVEAAAKESGLALDLSRQERHYPTIAAHTLVRHAHAKGTQRALMRALYEANFDDAKDIADPAVLAEVAARHGFDRDEAERIAKDDGELAQTRGDAREGVELGIRGVPFVIFGRALAVNGAQPIEVFRDAIARAIEA